MPEKLSLEYTPPGETLAAFRKAASYVRGLIGPLGGGREVCAVYDILLRSVHLPQRRWRWAVIRADSAGLEDETLRAWHAVVPAALGNWDAKALRHQFAFSYKGRPKDIEVQFLGLNRPEHRARLATLATSGFWLDDARHLDEGLFERCLELAGGWPDDEAPAPFILATSLMPAADHWLNRRAELRLFRQPGGRTPQAENLKGRYPMGELAPGHYQRITVGRTADWVRVMVDAEWAAAHKAGSLEDRILQSYRLEAA